MNKRDVRLRGRRDKDTWLDLGGLRFVLKKRLEIANTSRGVMECNVERDNPPKHFPLDLLAHFSLSLEEHRRTKHFILSIMETWKQIENGFDHQSAFISPGDFLSGDRCNYIAKVSLKENQSKHWWCHYLKAIATFSSQFYVAKNASFATLVKGAMCKNWASVKE